MITNNIFLTLTIGSIIIALISESPVNTSYSLLILGATLISSVCLTTGENWFPILFFIIFIGGILLIFIILSALMPNQQQNNINNIFTILLIAITIMLILPSQEDLTNSVAEINISSFYSAYLNTSILILVILIYFCMFINILSNENYPLNSNFYRINIIL